MCKNVYKFLMKFLLSIAENVKEKAYPSKESQDDDNHESKKSPKDYGYLKKESTGDMILIVWLLLFTCYFSQI